RANQERVRMGGWLNLFLRSRHAGVCHRCQATYFRSRKRYVVDPGIVYGAMKTAAAIALRADREIFGTRIYCHRRRKRFEIVEHAIQVNSGSCAVEGGCNVHPGVAVYRNFVVAYQLEILTRCYLV